MSDEAIRILVVDGRVEIRDGLLLTLARAAGMAIVHETVYGVNLDNVASFYAANIAVLGSLRDTSVFLALDQAQHADRAIKTVILLDYLDATTARDGWYGVIGALLRSELDSSLENALRSIGHGTSRFSPALMPLVHPSSEHRLAALGYAALQVQNTTDTAAPNYSPQFAGFPFCATRAQHATAGPRQPILASPILSACGRGEAAP